ncbi:hypothetical protein Tco_0340646 [Tanacetum coccineum]
MVPIDCTWDKRNILLRFMILSACWTSIQPMLDKDCMILEKLNGVKDDTGVIRTKKYAELSAAEKIQADCGESYQYHSLRKESVSCFAVPVFSPKDDPITCLNKAMAFLTAVAFSKFPTTNNQLRTSSNPRNQATIQDGRVTVQELLNATTAKVKDIWLEAREAGQILDEEQLTFLADPGIPASQAQTVIPHNAAFQIEDLDTYDSDCDDLSTAQTILMANISNYGSDVISEVPKSETYLNDMDNQSVHALHDFEQSPVMDFTDNEISNFETRFSPQQELSAQQAFWFHTFNSTIEPSYSPPVIVEVPSELPKASLVNASLKKLKFHLTQFDSVVKKRKPLVYLEESVNGDLLNEITEVQTVFDQMEASVQQFSVDKKCLEIAKKEILLENDRLLQKIVSQDVMLTVMNSMSLNNDSVNVKMQKIFEINDLKARLQDKDTTICKLKDIIKSLRENTKEENVDHDKCEFEPIKKELENSVAKLLSENERKEIVKNVVHIPFATTIAPGMFKLDLEPLPPRLLHNREVHIDYLRNIKEQANILRIQELLVYVQDTCPNAITPSSKKVVVTPMNKGKKVRFAESLTSSKVKCSTSNCGSKPSDNKRNDKISQKPSRNKKNKVEPNLGKSMFDVVHDKCLLDFVQNKNIHSKSAKKHKKQNIWKPTGHVFTEIVLWYMDSGCSKHMTGNRSQLMNFVSKFLGIVRFGNDQIARIMGIKFQKDHLYSACALGKGKKSSHQPKAEDTNQEKLYLLNIDLYGPMRVASINGKRMFEQIMEPNLSIRHFMNGMKMLARIKLLQLALLSRTVLSKGEIGLLLKPLVLR